MIYAILSVCVAIALLLFLHYMTQKMAEERLNEAYNQRYQRENKKARLTAEKTEDIILTSEMNMMKTPAILRFNGSFDTLKGIKAEDGDIVAIRDKYDIRNYLRKDGKWYEIVDDIADYRRRLKL